MISLKSTELLTTVVQELAYTAPQGWRKFVYYREMLMDAELGLRNKYIVLCWWGREMSVHPQTYEVGGSMEVMRAINALYEDSVKTGNTWTGILLTVHDDGKYSSQFFYEDTPLLDNNNEQVDRIIAGAAKG